MTDFVLNQKQSESFNEKTFINESLISLEKIRNYANFLKQPLKLEMFVPCDDEDNVLEEPIVSEHLLDRFSQQPVKDENTPEAYRYRKAKEKVLFEDSVLIDETMYHQTKRMLIMLKSYSTFRIFNQFYYRDGSIERQLFPSNENLRIEDLIKFELELTESAIKQIGL